MINNYNLITDMIDGIITYDFIITKYSLLPFLLYNKLI